jgi:hypothetical protein
MKLGVTFPLFEIGNDPGGIKAYVQAAEKLGFDNVHCGDHIVGTDPRAHPTFTTGYTHLQPSLDPLVLFGFLAAVTTRIELTTGVLLLTERQAVLVAKQAASLDVLSNGRLRLGVGVGAFEPEFEAVREEFRHRGERSGPRSQSPFAGAGTQWWDSEATRCRCSDPSRSGSVVMRRWCWKERDGSWTAGFSPGRSPARRWGKRSSGYEAKQEPPDATPPRSVSRVASTSSTVGRSRAV